MKAALVALSGTAYSYDKLYSYDAGAFPSAAPGMRVMVSFGRGSAGRIGLIVRTEEVSGKEFNLKPLLQLMDSEPVLNAEMLMLLEWLKENTFCTYFDALSVLLPAGLKLRICEGYALCDPQPSLPLEQAEEELFTRMKRMKSASARAKCAEYAPEILINALIAKGFIAESCTARREIGDSSIKMLRLSGKYLSAPESFMLTASQKKVVELLAENGALSVREASYMAGVTRTVVANLVKSGAAEEYVQEQLRIPLTGEKGTGTDGIMLSEEQQTVFDSLTRHLDTLPPSPGAFLLHGITGSGKTSVFAKLAGEVTRRGRQVLFLIPEISLTPQTVAYFVSLFGDTVAVMHSSLPLTRRLDEYKRVKRGEAGIVVGTRSAVFAPLDNIGLIIIDEEGESSYKSESAPRYSTATVARQRCRIHNALLLLASATPSVDSYYLAQRGVYTLLEMHTRYSGAPLPAVKIIDMTFERQAGNYSSFSEELIDEVNGNIKRGEQSILLLNRRGYHTAVTCADCRETLYCPNCSIPLTYHKTNASLMCHYCGYVCGASKCLKCGGERLRPAGTGTQRLEEELALFFPDARILRMDADTAFNAFAYEQSFRDFADGKYDILLGTQMIGKGLNFPNVTLVGVLSVDKSLFFGDFRSYERTFSLIAQVVGRGGRSDKPGRALLQTFMPDHYVLQLAAMQDYRRFYDEEISLRRALVYPPICDICVIGISAIIDNDAADASAAIIGLLKDKIKRDNPVFPLRVLGPVKAAHEKINGKYRYRIIIKCKNTSELRAFIASILMESGKIKSVSRCSVYADMNGDIL